MLFLVFTAWMNDVHKASHSHTEYDWYQCHATQVNKEENFSITAMIHESDYSHFDLFSRRNPHAGKHLLNTPCVLLVSSLKLQQTWFCDTGLEMRRNVEEDTELLSLWCG